jgi:3-oxoacyl-[acyl-carrier protein] reductase
MVEDKVVLITGTSRGIGHYLATHLCNQGYRVIGCSRSDHSSPASAFQHFQLDVTDEPAVKGMFKQVRQAYGKLDILINNAGIAAMNHCLTMPLASVKAVFETNVYGPFLFSREAAKLMRKTGGGRIVNFASVAVPLRLSGEAAYAASKAAVVSLTQIMAKELAAYGITVNAIGPTPVKTDLIKGVPKEKIDALISLQAIRRLGTFADIVNVIEFFIKPESDFVTGQTVFLGGVS